MLYWNLAVNPDLVLGLARRTSPFNTNGREGTKLSHNFLNLTHVPLESANNRTYGYFSTPSMCWGRVLPHWTPEALWSAFVSVQPVKTCEESNMQEKAYVFFFVRAFIAYLVRSCFSCCIGVGACWGRAVFIQFWFAVCFIPLFMLMLNLANDHNLWSSLLYQAISVSLRG